MLSVRNMGGWFLFTGTPSRLPKVAGPGGARRGEGTILGVLTVDRPSALLLGIRSALPVTSFHFNLRLAWQC